MKIIKLLPIIILACTITACQDTVNTAYNEFKPSSLLKKYEYFKDMSAQLDKKVADINIYSSRLTDLKEQYKKIPRKEWARDDREQYSIWSSELAGVKASYNFVAANYNSAMSKFNYSFCNTGSLPEGASNPLPKEYKPYIEN